MDYCDRHFDDKSSCEQDKEKAWTAINDKISMKWLFAIIPVLMLWIGFQVVIYDSLKNLETKVAVIEEQLRKK